MFNHAFDFAFEVISDNEEAEDVTPATNLSAFRPDPKPPMSDDPDFR